MYYSYSSSLSLIYILYATSNTVVKIPPPTSNGGKAKAIPSCPCVSTHSTTTTKNNNNNIGRRQAKPTTTLTN